LNQHSGTRLELFFGEEASNADALHLGLYVVDFNEHNTADMAKQTARFDDKPDFQH